MAVTRRLSVFAAHIAAEGAGGQAGRRACGGRASLAAARAASSKAQAVVVERFGGPEVLQMGETRMPLVGPSQVLVAIQAAGVNPSDTYIRLGPQGPYAGKPQLLPKLPYTPGKDGAGTVEDVGSNVEDVRVGDRVYVTNSVTGTYASRAMCEAKTVFRLPAAVSFAQGACVGVPCATAYYALHIRAQLSQGERVFIHGASGAVGLAAVQLARAAGAGLIVGSAGTRAGEAAVLAAGADAAVNHRSAEYLGEAGQKAESKGFDVILEMSAHSNLPADLGLLARRGRLCIIGSRAEEVGLNPRLVMSCEADVRGVFLPMASPQELVSVHQALVAAMEAGALAPVVGQQLPLAEAPTAHVEVMQPSAGGAAGNIVLIP